MSKVTSISASADVSTCANLTRFVRITRQGLPISPSNGATHVNRSVKPAGAGYRLADKTNQEHVMPRIPADHLESRNFREDQSFCVTYNLGDDQSLAIVAGGKMLYLLRNEGEIGDAPEHGAVIKGAQLEFDPLLGPIIPGINAFAKFNLLIVDGILTIASGVHRGAFDVPETEPFSLGIPVPGGAAYASPALVPSAWDIVAYANGQRILLFSS
ncbi:hypothetical protein U1707_10070 [Sphingomonas sp. PB2P12]|uniref:hypothetical protein n=1 Tax=Sphingomonas sandaracina TaxID=3096157 RepID=UPI002FC645E3